MKMCYSLYHKCRFCNAQYECALENYICPTINKDENHHMCPACELQEKNDFRIAMETGILPKNRPLTLDDWEK